MLLAIRSDFHAMGSDLDRETAAVAQFPHVYAFDAPKVLQVSDDAFPAITRTANLECAMPVGDILTVSHGYSRPSASMYRPGILNSTRL